MNIDIAIVVGFLVLNLGIGLYYGRGVKSIKDYALGDRNFSTSALVATTVATTIGGGFFAGAITESYRQGLYFIIPALGEPLALIIVSLFLIPRMREFIGKVSVAEAMGTMFGKYVQIITALLGIFLCAGIIALQFRVSASIFQLFFGISGFYATMLSAVIVVVYSTFGGIKAVTFTDLMQFFTFGSIVPMVALMIWKTIGSPNEVFDIISTNPMYDWHEVFDLSNPKFISAFFLLLFFLVPGFQPVFFQRVTMSNNIQQAKKVFLIAGFVSLVILLITSFLGTLILSDNNHLDPNNLLLYIIEKYSYVGFRGVFAIGVISIIMSTADSYINSASTMFTNDLFKLTFSGKGERKEMFILQLFSVFIGSLAFVLAFKASSILNLLLFILGCYMPIVSVPLLFAICGFRSSQKSVLTGMGAGFITVVCWNVWMTELNIDSVIPGVVANILFLFGSHYLLKQEGGWSKYPDFVDESRESSDVKKNSRLSLFQTFRLNFLRLLNLKYYNKYLPKQESTYHYFVFAVFLTILVTLSISKPVYDKSFFWINVFQAIAFSVATLFLCKGLWIKFVQNYLGIIWCISIFISLAFVSIFLVLMSNFSYISLTIMTLHLVMISILVGWRASLVMIALGLWLAFYLYTSFIGEPAASEVYDLKVKLLYILFMAGGFAITILKNKQEEQEATEAKVGTLEEEVADLNEQVVHYSERVEDQGKEIERLGATAQRILNNVNHELRLPVGNVMNFAEMLNDGLGKFNEEQLKMLSDEVYQNSNRLSSMIMNMLDLATLEAKKIELNKSTINFGELVRDRVQSCRKMYLGDKKIDFEMQIEEDVLIKVDPNYMRQTVDNLVINAINFSSEGVIRISVLRKGKGVEFVISDNGIGIPREDLYDIFTPFKMGSNAESKAEGRGVGLALCKAAVEAHGGRISAESKGGKGAQFRFVL